MYIQIGVTGEATLKAQMRAAMARRQAADRFSRTPRLTRQEELDAIERFRSEKGVTACPTAYAESVIGC